jgi:hypothetical protein
MMSPHQRAKLSNWLREWGPIAGGLLGGFGGFLLALLVAAGFGLITPAQTLASVEVRLAQLERDHAGFAPVYRYLCSLDPERGYMTGVPGCEQPNHNKVTGPP